MSEWRITAVNVVWDTLALIVASDKHRQFSPDGFIDVTVQSYVSIGSIGDLHR